MTIQQVIDALVAYHPYLEENPDFPATDVIKFGDPARECTGVVVTCTPTVEVIRKTIELGANFLITHEPLFWNHEDQTDWLEGNRLYQQKKQLLEENGITVWRDHDHIHGGAPHSGNVDKIFQGIMHELGWENYLIGGGNKPLLFQIPEMDATELGLFLKEKLGLNGIRIVGDKHTKVSKVMLWEHIREQDYDGSEKRKLLQVEEEQFDAVIPFETIDWTILAYIRDSAQMGNGKILYNVGHFNFEDLGMRYMMSYLPGLIEGVPVHHVTPGDAYDFIL